VSHSVARHLGIAIEAYDRMIRQFIPGYDAMLDQAVAAVLTASSLERIIDLGAGTGSLSDRLLDQATAATVELWDVDEAMLAQGRGRLARFGSRAVFRRASFFEPLPACSAVMASLALHHVRDLETKTALYRHVAAALRPGGIFVNADATVPADPAVSRAVYRHWAQHQVASGIAESQAWRNFEEWAEEDRYFPLEVELDAMERAGLAATCPWRLGPSTVMVGRKPLDARRA
jgi:tRNA (cmo5U34)-methyltransferase